MWAPLEEGQLLLPGLLSSSPMVDLLLSVERLTGDSLGRTPAGSGGSSTPPFTGRVASRGVLVMERERLLIALLWLLF